MGEMVWYILNWSLTGLTWILLLIGWLIDLRRKKKRNILSYEIYTSPTHFFWDGKYYRVKENGEWEVIEGEEMEDLE